MIRPTQPRDTPELVALARDTEVFKPGEIVALQEVLDDYHLKEAANGHLCVSYEQDGTLIGFAYDAPSAMADRAWYLYWIVVGPHARGKGIGATLLRHSEEVIKSLGGRLYLIETSSLPHYEPTRSFYLKQGFRVASILPDFYADDDDLVIFSKRLIPKEGSDK